MAGAAYSQSQRGSRRGATVWELDGEGAGMERVRRRRGGREEGGKRSVFGE